MPVHNPDPYPGWVMRGTTEDVLEGDGFYYRPRQILFEAGHAWSPMITSQLKQAGGMPDEALNQEFAQAKLSVQAWLMPPLVNIPGLVARLREHKPGQPAPVVGPNHVFCGEPNYEGGPDGEPQNAPPVDERPWATGTAAAPGVTVIDTGYDPAVPTLHTGLKWRVSYPAGSQENPITSLGYIAAEGGHGTFIDGIIMRLAPAVCIEQLRVLSPDGTTDDGRVALAIAQASAPVINLSLGGYAQQDVPPVASGNALARLNPDSVVVAAAGNHGQAEVFWPAAFSTLFPNVVAVGALDTTASGPPALADFSNFSARPGDGGWVDVYAPGVNVLSTYLDATWKLPADSRPRPIDGWATWNGTSFAAPQVAAAIAAAMARTPGQTAAQAWAAVKAGSTQVLPASGGWPGGLAYIPQPGVIG